MRDALYWFVYPVSCCRTCNPIIRRDCEGWLMLLLFLRENFLFVGFKTTFYLLDVFTRRQ